MRRLTLILLLTAASATLTFGEVIYSPSNANGVSYIQDGMSFLWGNLLPPHNPTLDDWTVQTNHTFLSSPTIADVDGDGSDDILITAYEGLLYAFDGEGNALTGFPVQMTGAAPATPAVGDIDVDGDMEIVQGTWNYLYVFNHDGSTYPGFPITMYVTQSAALEDMDYDGDLEIIVPSGSSMNVLHHNGTQMTGFPVTAAHDLTSAAVGDVDDYDGLEIVAGSFVASGSPLDYVYVWHMNGTSAPGFPVSVAGSVKSAPALADFDDDNLMEIAVDCWSQYSTDLLYAIDYHGFLMAGFPVSIPYIRLSSPSIADIDLDDDLEIIVGGWSTAPAGEVIHVYHHNGTPLTGFPVTLPNNPSGNVNSTPTVGDIDGDGYPEIVLKAVNHIYAVNHNGTIVTGFPVFLDDENHSGTSSPTPALGDPDNDGQIEIVAAACYNSIMLIDQSGYYAAEAVQWGSYKSDHFNRGFYNPQPQTSVIVTLTPAQIPTIIPPGGGSFDFNIEISNLSGENQTFDVWTNVILPNGNIYGPLILVQNVTLPPNTTVDRDREQVVPGNAPAGVYFFNAFVGDYPNNIWDSGSFPFNKMADGD